ncbi:MAG: RHS repeat-associated core domain-containing protein [Actinomycetota bacterium]
MDLGGGSISSVPVGVEKAPGILEKATVRYAEALPSTDLVGSLVSGGYDEAVILKDASAPTTVSWRLTTIGLSLSTSESTIDVLGPDGATIAQIPALTAWDSSAVPLTTTLGLTLTDQGLGSYLLTATLDPAWAKVATYPVTVDPRTVQETAFADTWILDGGNANHGADTHLNTSGSTQFSYVKFPTDWTHQDRLITSAVVWIRNDTQGNSSDLEARRIVSGWVEGVIDGNSEPGASTTPTPQTSPGPTGGWFSIQFKKLYQNFNDGLYPDYGVRLQSTGTKSFWSRESADAPYLEIDYDDLPDPLQANAMVPPNDGQAVDNVTPTLKIGHLPNDQNNDEVLVRYQVTDVLGDWSNAKESNWIDETKFTVPSGWIKPGAQYWWRVQGADVCVQPDTLCPQTDGAGVFHSWNTSPVWSFSSATKNWGDDDRYQMWSQDLGSSMTMNVNEANGNLFLQVPIDSLSTPIGKLRIGLSYNSQAAFDPSTDKGMGPGWKLYAGPTSSGRQMPIELKPPGSNTPWDGVRVFFKAGGHDTYAWRGGNSYSNIGSSASVRSNNDGSSWTYRTDDGDVYAFDAQGHLTKAKPVFTKDKVVAGNGNFRYDVSTDGRLLSVTDPIGRVVDFTWTNPASGPNRLINIHTWAGTAFNWVVDYGGTGHIRNITTPVAETMHFDYGSNAQQDFISQVKNGEQYGGTDTGPGWNVTYFHDQAPSPNYTVYRVKKVYPPQPTLSQYWNFAYGTGPADYAGWTSLATKITDPRGTDASSGFSDDYQTTVQFNTQGLPIEVRAPKKDPTTEPDWVTRMVWDSNGHVMCSRSPQANAISANCTSTTNTQNEFSTVYDYETKEPFRLKTVTEPAPSTGASRMLSTYEYDAGGAFTGLWVEMFENPNLAGIPDSEGLWDTIDRNWGTGAPSGIANNDQWSIRASGFIDIPNRNAKNYEFRVTSDDGVTLAIGSDVLMNCFGLTASQEFQNPNCGVANWPTKKLWPGRMPITLEYQEKTGDANVKLEWREKGTNTWVVIPSSSLFPNLGLLTKKTVGPNTGTNSLQLETSWSYAGDIAKQRRLPGWRQTTDLGPNAGPEAVQRTAFEYDDYGRKTSITKFADSATWAATTLRTFSDDPQGGSCLTKVESPTHILGRFTCNASGDLTQTKLVMDVVNDPSTGDQLDAGVNRVTDITYDRVGRKLTQTGTAGTKTTFVYDESGRVLSETHLLEDAGTPTVTTDDTNAVTANDYQDYASPSPKLVVTRPDSVQVTHAYDWVGNETEATDPRNAQLSASWSWKTVYDAQNRATQSWTPDPDGGGTKTPLKTVTAYSVNPFQTSVTDPAGVMSVSKMDLLGRTSITQGSVSGTSGVAPTYTTYDRAGNVRRVEQKDATNSYSWVEHDYNAYGQVVADRQPWRDDANSGVVRTLTSTHTYFANGLPRVVDGPLGLDFSTTNLSEAGTADPTEKDVTSFNYDKEGRTASVTYWTSDVRSWTTNVIYNDAGEQAQLSSQLTASASPTYQTRRWEYTTAGQVAKYKELHGTGVNVPCQSPTPGVCTTTNTYDEGGRLLTTADGRPCTVTNTYDLVDQLTDHVASGSGCAGNEHFDYWANGLQKQAKQNASGSTSTFNMDYDFMGRPTTVKNGTTVTTSYTYRTVSGQETGQLASVTTDAGTTGYTWCAANAGGCFAGLLSSVDDPLLTGVTNYTYDAAARISTRVDNNGTWALTWTRGYELQTSRINTQTIKKATSVLGDFDVDYDEAGNVIKRKENVGTDPRNSTWTYSYDAASRMLSATGKDPATLTSPPTLTWNYAYDGMGNRTSATKPSGSGTITYTLDGQGWPVADDAGAGGTTYSYDAVGDLTFVNKDGSTTTNDWTYVYDAWSRTTQAKKGPPSAPTLTLDYKIDALGRMQRRTAGTPFIDYSYEGVSETLAKATPSSSSATLYSNTPGGPLAQKVGTATAQVLLRDLHGDVVGSVNAGGTSTASQSWYSAWGERTGSSSDLGFQSQWTDTSTLEVDMTTRMYSAAIGRFSSRDPLSGSVDDPMSLNQFAYVTANPATLTDLFGLCADRGADGCPDQSVSQWHKVKDHYAEVRANDVEAHTDYYDSDEYLFWITIEYPDIAPLLFRDDQAFMDVIYRLNVPGEGLQHRFPAGTTYEDLDHFDDMSWMRTDAYMSWAAAHGLLPSGWQMVQAGGLAVCAVATASTCAWTTVGITTTKIGYSAHDHLMGDHDADAFARDTLFNATGGLVSLIPRAGNVLSAGCALSRWCSSNQYSPLGENPAARYSFPAYPHTRGNLGL